MGGTGTQPAFSGYLQGGPRLPDGAGHRELGQGATGLDHIHHIHDQTETLPHIGQGDHNRILAGRCGEDQADGILPVSDGERMNLQAGPALCQEGRRDLQHVGTHDLLLARHEVIGVVLHQGAATLEAIPHDVADADQNRGLPIPLCRESVPVGHQPLGADSGQLVQGTQVLEVIDGRRGPDLLEHVAHARLLPGGHHQGVVPGIKEFGGHIVAALVVFDQVLDLVILDGPHMGHQFIDRPGVDGDPENAFGLGLVALGHGHIAHVVAPPADLHGIGGIPTGAGPGPGPDSLRHLGIGVVPHDNLAGNAQAGKDVPELAVTVGRLVQVHEVHVDGLPGDFDMVLRIQLEKGLPQLLQSTDPHLGRAEGVHPGHNADAGRVGGGVDHEIPDGVRVLQGRLENQPDRNFAGVVQGLRYVGGLHGHLPQGVLAIEVLGTHCEPEFLTLEWICHCHGCSLLLLLIMVTYIYGVMGHPSRGMHLTAACSMGRDLEKRSKKARNPSTSAGSGFSTRDSTSAKTLESR